MKTTDKVLFWSPRIIGILAILFISMFALDAFDSHVSVGEQILAFLIHLIPSFVLLAVLLVAWKWEFVGGIIFVVTGLGMSPLIFMHNYVVNHFSIAQCSNIVLLINLPFVVIGGLFIAHHYLVKKAKQ